MSDFEPIHRDDPEPEGSGGGRLDPPRRLPQDADAWIVAEREPAVGHQGGEPFPEPGARPALELDREGPRRAVFVHLTTSGEDPSLDGLLGIEALRPTGAGRFESFVRRVRPELPADASGLPADAPGIETPHAAQRRPSEHDAAEAVALTAEQAWHEFARFAAGRPWIALDAESFTAWGVHFEGQEFSSRCLLGLVEFAALWMPGRRERSPEQWLRRLQGGSAAAAGRPANGPLGARDVLAALGVLTRRAQELSPEAAELVWASALRALELLRGVDDAAALRFELALGVLREPELFEEPGASRPRTVFATAHAECLGRDPVEVVREAVEELEPRWKAVDAGREPTVPVTGEEDLPFSEQDLALVDRIFEHELGALAAQDGEELSYRPGQHEVARAVARTLGSRELLLVHAPTGTGKTLAYIVPALIWAARHDVRVGVVTYTRALQEQAMDREVPRALRVLERAAAQGDLGLPRRPRVALLKGRANYLCWRALRLHAPSEEDGHETWLAWLHVTLFGLRDDTGDLDRLPLRAAFGVGSRAREDRELETLVRQVRAQVGCCQHREDRATCGAEAARQRAERAHVVIANHAFALVKQTFFKHVIFDECEHLHEQAHAAWSHSTSIEEARQLLQRVRQESRSSSRAPLDRLERLALPSSAVAQAVAVAAEAWRDCATGLDLLEIELEKFVVWRAEEARARDGRDDHSLLCEYVLNGDSAKLVAARGGLYSSLSSLSASLSVVAELLDTLALRGVPRLRRQLDLVRVEIDELALDLEAWMPSGDERVQYNEHTFYDVELDARGRQVLAARVLLPNEYLGRHYYPELKNAVLLSATTWLRGGFESAKSYLGLDRAENPAPGEERPACSVRCMRAPDPFDYGRVLVALPSDAPSYSDARAEWNAYVRRFIAELGERTRGRMLVLFTNQEELRRFGEELAGFFSARRIPFWYQGMRGVAKEELAGLFRGRIDSILMGVDTFWYGADFPGETLEYLVIVKLPYGVPDRYHHAQCAALGSSEQRRRIYMPRALAKFRQGFGRLMRRETDRGCVFLLDPRAREPRHRLFLAELPLAGGAGSDATAVAGARLARGTTEECLREALGHMGRPA